eukprot:s1168_g15.t1
MLGDAKDARLKTEWDWSQPKTAQKPMVQYIREMMQSTAATSAAAVLTCKIVAAVEKSASVAFRAEAARAAQGTTPMTPRAPPPAPDTTLPTGPPSAPAAPTASRSSPNEITSCSSWYGKSTPRSCRISSRLSMMPSEGTAASARGVPVPSNSPPNDLVVVWAGYQPIEAPNRNPDVMSNPPATGELNVEVPYMKTTSAIGVDRDTRRRRRVSPQGMQQSHRNATNAVYSPKGWTQSVNTGLFHRVYENLS